MYSLAAAACGLLATGAALGAAELAAALSKPQTGPLLAVGSAFIDLTPAWLKDFAIRTFGGNDKNVLLLVLVIKETLAKVLADKKTLTDILTYHVVQGRKTPADLENGSFTTLQGGTVTTTGSGEDFKADDAAVLCGNVSTRNATVYIIDTVLMPKS